MDKGFIITQRYQFIEKLEKLDFSVPSKHNIKQDLKLSPHKNPSSIKGESEYWIGYVKDNTETSRSLDVKCLTETFL